MTTDTSTTLHRRSAAALFSSNQFGLLLVVVGFVLAFTFGTRGFSSTFNLFALGRVLAIDIMIGYAMMVVLVTGGLNLAVGAIGVSSVMFGGWLMEVVGLPPLIAVPITIGFGAFLGWINGYVSVRSGVHSFIITLATMSIFFGAMIVSTGAQPFRALPPEFIQFGKMRLFGIVSPLLFVTLTVTLFLIYLFNYSIFGRKILAAGANPAAAELSGVPVGRMFIYGHAMSGALACIAGLMLTMRNGAALPSMAGQLGADWLLPSFLAPVLGGTLLTGGVISVIGTLLGATLVTIINNGLLLLQVGEFWVQMFLGLILLAAVVLDRARGVLAERRRAMA